MQSACSSCRSPLSKETNNINTEITKANKHAYPAPAYSWYVVIILFFAYALSFIDRQIIAFLVGPIRADFQISDFQFSLLHGIAFALFYTLMGIPLGRIADRYNRRNLIAIGIGAWSFMTAMCGAAGNYWQLFLARIGVGVGEASLGPAAFSVISDSFAKETRGLAMSVYSAGILCGAGLANIFGGIAVEYALEHGPQNLPLLGSVRPWQFSFFLVSLPGIVVIALMLLTVKEPLRRERISHEGTVSLGSTLAYIRRYWRAYATVIGATTCFALSMYGLMSWVPAFYERNFSWNRAQIGQAFGSIFVFLGTSGLVCSGLLARKAMRKGTEAAYLKVMLYSQLCSLLPLALLVAVHNPYWSLGCLAAAVFFLSFHLGLAPAALHSITPNEMRGQIIAIYIFVLTLIGLGAGSPAIAAMTDYYFQNDIAVGKSIAVVTSVSSTIGIILLLTGIGAYRETVRATAL